MPPHALSVSGCRYDLLLGNAFLVSHGLVGLFEFAGILGECILLSVDVLISLPFTICDFKH